MHRAPVLSALCCQTHTVPSTILHAAPGLYSYRTCVNPRSLLLCVSQLRLVEAEHGLPTTTLLSGYMPQLRVPVGISCLPLLHATYLSSGGRRSVVGTALWPCTNKTTKHICESIYTRFPNICALH